MSKLLKKITAALLLLCIALAALPITAYSAAVQSISSMNLDDSALRSIYFKVETDKDLASYAVGEDIVFGVSLWADHDGDGNKGNDTLIGAPYFKWSLRGDDGFEGSGYADGSSGFAEIKAKLQCAGAIRLEIEPANAGKNAISHSKITKFEGGAIADASDITPTTAEPADFDGFWADQLAELDAVSPEIVEITEIPNSNADFKTYEVHIACVDDTCETQTGNTYVAAVLTYPVNAEAGSLGLRLYYHGYGVNGSTGPRNLSNTAFMSVYAHSIPLQEEASYYTDLKNTTLNRYGFSPEQNTAPKTSYFRNMLLRDVQAVRFLKKYFGDGVTSNVGGVDTSRWAGLWNGDDIMTEGDSQGGFQAISVAALDSSVTEVRAGVPWLADVAGNTVEAKIQSTSRPEFVAGMAYYDTALMAKRVKAPIVNITAGTGDTLCPMSAVQSVYNNLDVEQCSVTFIQGHCHAPTDTYPVRSLQLRAKSPVMSGEVNMPSTAYRWEFDTLTRALTMTATVTSGWNETRRSDSEGGWSDIANYVSKVILKGKFDKLSWNAFANMPHLESVTLPASVKQIDSAAFMNCPSLTEVRYEGDAYLPRAVDLSRVTGAAAGDDSMAGDSNKFKGATSVTAIILNDIYTDELPIIESNMPENLETVIGPRSSQYLRDYCETKGLKFLSYGKTETVNAAWIYDETARTLRVFGEGKVEGLLPEDTEYLSAARALIIDETVTELSADAFAELAGLKNVTFKGDAPAIDAGARPFGENDVELTVSPDAEGFTGEGWCGYPFAVPEVKPTPGDVNGDTKVDAKDAVLLAQYLAKWSVEVDQLTSDTNGDGSIDAKDAVLLAQYLAKWNVTMIGGIERGDVEFDMSDFFT